MAKKAQWIPDFKSIEERDKYFLENAEYFVLFRQRGVGNRYRIESKSITEVEKLAKLCQTLEPNSRWMIYAVIGEQSAFVKGIK